jgi:hypothetical protein
MKPYNISPEESLTLRDVEALTNSGNDVTLTPHIGNIWRANMAVTDLGVKVAVYEGNCNGRDVDEYPGHLRMDNKFIPLVDETRPIMSTHLKFKPDMDVPYLSRQGLGSTPAQVHYNAMRRIFPEKQITLLAEYLYTSDPEIRDMLVYLVNHHHAFNRKLNLDGTVEVVELWNQEKIKTVRLPLLKAMSEYRHLSEQPITNEKIKLKSSPEPVRPSLGNWLRSYREEIGIGFQVGQYLMKCFCVLKKEKRREF